MFLNPSISTVVILILSVCNNSVFELYLSENFSISYTFLCDVINVQSGVYIFFKYGSELRV